MNEILNRCKFCGKLLDEQGNELKGAQRQQMVRIMLSGKGAFVEKTGECCEHKKDRPVASMLEVLQRGLR